MLQLPLKLVNEIEEYMVSRHQFESWYITF